MPKDFAWSAGKRKRKFELKHEAQIIEGVAGGLKAGSIGRNAQGSREKGKRQDGASSSHRIAASGWWGT